MGASGQAWFCQRGHLYHWIDEDLWWDDVLEARSRRAEAGCPCGETAVTCVLHYGDLNYGREPHQRLLRLGADRWRRSERVTGASDRQGNPVEAYVDRWYAHDIYDVSSLDFGSR